MSDKAKETFYNNSNYDPKKFDKDSDKMPTTGAKNGLNMSDMYGKDYDDAELGQSASSSSPSTIWTTSSPMVAMAPRL